MVKAFCAECLVIGFQRNFRETLSLCSVCAQPPHACFNLVWSSSPQRGALKWFSFLRRFSFLTHSHSTAATTTCSSTFVRLLPSIHTCHRSQPGTSQPLGLRLHDSHLAPTPGRSPYCSHSRKGVGENKHTSTPEGFARNRHYTHTAQTLTPTFTGTQTHTHTRTQANSHTHTHTYVNTHTHALMG